MHHIISDISNPVNLQQYIDNRDGFKRVGLKSFTYSGFSLTPYLESFTPIFGLGTPVFPRICSNLHCGTPTFSKRCLWDSYFQNPSENPDTAGVGIIFTMKCFRKMVSLLSAYSPGIIVFSS